MTKTQSPRIGRIPDVLESVGDTGLQSEGLPRILAQPGWSGAVVARRMPASELLRLRLDVDQPGVRPLDL